MQNNQLNPTINDVRILDERDVPAPKSILYFIHNQLLDKQLSELKVTEIPISRPTYFSKTITACVQNTAPAIMLEYGQINSLRSLARNLKAFLYNLVAKKSKPLSFNTNVFDVRDISPNNIAHLMVQAIPLCLHARDLAGPDIEFIFTKMGAPFKTLLNEFGINPIISNKKIKAPFIKISATRGFAAYNIATAFDCQTFTFLPNVYEKYQFSSGLAGMHKIFISRRGMRGLVNHNEVEQLLTSKGYKTVFMEDYSLAVQLGIASEATDIVAVHGASMGMLVLRKSINSLIEICPPNAYQDYFAVALGDRVKKHIQMMDSFDSRVRFNDYSVIAHYKNQPFSANIVQLNHALAMID
jgi:hypothetical protein